MHSINFIILAHDKPEQLGKLVAQLLDTAAAIYIHIDLKSDIEMFMPFLNFEKVILLKNRVSCKWGDYSLVEATLRCIECVIAEKRPGHTILLSGHDYPIRSNSEIRSFFEAHKHVDFIDCRPIKEVWPNHFKYRIQAYKYDFSSQKADYVCIPTLFSLRPRGIVRNITLLIKRSIRDKQLSHLTILYKLFLYKIPPTKTSFFGGSQWWAITNSTLELIYNYSKNNNEFTLFFKDTQIPDEVFFQTALKNVQKFNPKIFIENNLTFTKWLSLSDNSPETLTTKHYDELVAASSNYLFARKFDISIDKKIIELLDRHISDHQK